MDLAIAALGFESVPKFESIREYSMSDSEDASGYGMVPNTL